MNKQGTAGRDKCDFNIAIEVINDKENWKWWKLKRAYGFIQYGMVDYLWHKETNRPYTVVNGIQ
jgi:hypothetical protein